MQGGKGSISNSETPFGQEGVQANGKGGAEGASGSQVLTADRQPAVQGRVHARLQACRAMHQHVVLSTEVRCQRSADAWAQASGSQNQSVNVSQNVSQAPQQQGNGLPMGPQGMTVTHHHYHLLNHAGGPEVMAAMGVAGADQVGFLAIRMLYCGTL